MGEDGAEGTKVNVPLPSGSGDEGYLMAYRELLLPVALEFSPDIVLVSAGQDPHRDDPLGDEPDSSRICSHRRGGEGGGRLLLRGNGGCRPGGGYNLSAQAEAIVAQIRAFQGEVPEVSGFDSRVARRIDEIKAIHKAYWKCFQPDGMRGPSPS